MNAIRYYLTNPASRAFCLMAVLLTVNLFSLTGCRTAEPTLGKLAAGDKPVTGAVDSNSGPSHDGNGSPVVVNLSLVGDIMVHSDLLSSAYDRKSGGYSFAGVFSEVRPYLSGADLTIGNLETTLAGRSRGYTGFPKFNSPHEILPALREAGFDVLTNANNHALDRGVYGVVKTIGRLDQAGIKHTGAAASELAQSQPLIVEKNGLRLAILAYTYGTNGLPVPRGKSYLVNMLDIRQIRQDIKKARASGADLVLVSPHFGVEYRRFPGTKEKELVEQLYSAGADIVIGSHPHVLQTMARRNPADNRTGLFTAYSMGNFIASQFQQYRDSSVILNLKLEKDQSTGKIRLADAGYIPVWVDRYRQNGKTLFRVVAVEKAIRDYEQGLDPRLTSSDYARLKQVWQEINSVLAAPGSPHIEHT